MIDKNLTLDTTRTSCLKPELPEDIETGDLLNPEDSSDIETGDLLSSNSKVDISTGDLLTANNLPVTEGFPLNYARIGYDTILTTASGGGDDTLGAANLLTPSTYDKWRPTIDGTAVLIANSAQNVNYVGIAAHNLGSIGATLIVDVSPSFGAPHVNVYNGVPPSDSPLFIRFAEGSYDRVFIEINGVSTAEVGVVFMGTELEMMRPNYSGYSPATLSSTDVFTPQKSDGGQFLGKQLVRKGYATKASFQHLTYEWYESNFQPFCVICKDAALFLVLESVRAS